MPLPVLFKSISKLNYYEKPKRIEQCGKRKTIT